MKNLTSRVVFSSFSMSRELFMVMPAVFTVYGKEIINVRALQTMFEHCRWMQGLVSGGGSFLFVFYE